MSGSAARFPMGSLQTAAVTACLCLAVASLIVPVAAAAPEWLAPVRLSKAGYEPNAPSVAADARGDVVAIWEQFKTVEGGFGTQTVETISRRAGVGWRARTQLSEPSREGLEPQVAMDPAGDAVAVWRRTGPDYRMVVQAAFRSAGGSWEAPVALSEASLSAIEPQVALDANGDALAVWQFDNGVNYIVQAASRPAGGSWGSPVNISQGGANAAGPQLAVDAHGDAVVVWRSFNGKNDYVLAASRDGGGAWQLPVLLSEAGKNAVDPDVAMDSQGNALAAWSRGLEGGGIEASERPAGGAWQAPVEVSDSGTQPDYSPSVAFAEAGEATVLWERVGEPGEGAVQAASRPAGGPWATSITLSEAGRISCEPQLAVNAEGDAVAVWHGGEGCSQTVEAAARPRGGSWGAPVEVAGLASRVGNVAIDAHGNAATVWERHLHTDYAVQAAGYSASGPLLEDPEIPTSGTVGRAVSFAASATIVWSKLRESRWRFGDSSTATGGRVTHTYTATGDYEVTLESEDVLGNTTTASGTISIRP